MSKPSGKQCDSCKRLGASDRVIEGYRVPACDECMRSEVRIERMVWRARRAAAS